MSDTEADLAGLRAVAERAPVGLAGLDPNHPDHAWLSEWLSVANPPHVLAIVRRLQAAVAKVAQVEAIVTRLAADDPEYDTSYGAAGAMRLLADLRAALADPGDERGQ